MKDERWNENREVKMLFHIFVVFFDHFLYVSTSSFGIVVIYFITLSLLFFNICTVMNINHSRSMSYFGDHKTNYSRHTKMTKVPLNINSNISHLKYFQASPYRNIDP